MRTERLHLMKVVGGLLRSVQTHCAELSFTLGELEKVLSIRTEGIDYDLELWERERWETTNAGRSGPRHPREAAPIPGVFESATGGAETASESPGGGAETGCHGCDTYDGIPVLHPATARTEVRVGGSAGDSTPVVPTVADDCGTAWGNGAKSDQRNSRRKRTRSKARPVVCAVGEATVAGSGDVGPDTGGLVAATANPQHIGSSACVK